MTQPHIMRSTIVPVQDGISNKARVNRIYKSYIAGPTCAYHVTMNLLYLIEDKTCGNAAASVEEISRNLIILTSCMCPAA